MSSRIQNAVNTIRRHGAIAALSELSDLELAALDTYWPGWARPEQLPPELAWKSFGLLAGRGFGKTISNVNAILKEIRLGRAKRVAVVAQTDDDAVGVVAEGPSGFIEQSAPWARPAWNNKSLHFDGGAQIAFYSAESPSKLRGFQWDLALLTEVCAWPSAKKSETYANVLLGLRLGQARMYWDTTPKRGCSVLRELLQRSRLYPAEHIVRVGSSWDNSINLSHGTVAEWSRQLTGQRAIEEIEGRYTDGDMSAMFKIEDVEACRRSSPESYERRVIGVDPAISESKHSDLTGIVEAGFAFGQVYVTADLTGRYSPSTWAALVVERYVSSRCDCLVVERNAGGDLVVGMLRALAQQRGIQVVDVALDARTTWVPGVVHVKQLTSRISKSNRADPVVSLYEAHRVSHASDADLDELEAELLTWVPEAGMRSPNRIDALVFAVGELASLVVTNKVAASAIGAAGLQKKLAERATQAAAGGVMTSLLRRRGSGWGRGV